MSTSIFHEGTKKETETHLSGNTWVCTAPFSTLRNTGKMGIAGILQILHFDMRHVRIFSTDHDCLDLQSRSTSPEDFRTYDQTTCSSDFVFLSWQWLIRNQLVSLVTVPSAAEMQYLLQANCLQLSQLSPAQRIHSHFPVNLLQHMELACGHYGLLVFGKKTKLRRSLIDKEKS